MLVMKLPVLLVSCCLEQTRYNVLEQVVDNLLTYKEFIDENLDLYAIDNASTCEGVIPLLKSVANKDVYRVSRNVGYWTALKWWFDSLSDDNKYVYIIESDMIHYALDKIIESVKFLDENNDVGSVRQHEYSIENQHLYNKDKPHKDSRGLWQSHTNKVTQKPVEFKHIRDAFWKTTFLTHLPAVNRLSSLKTVFEKLTKENCFSEFDFQKLYWDLHKCTAIYDGGIFNCDLNPYNGKVVTSSWTSPTKLQQLGYEPTRQASISKDPYTVKVM